MVTRTSPVTLVLLAVFGAGVAWLLETVMVATGRPLVNPPITLGVALLMIGVIVVTMALPVYKVARKRPNARIDPFYATRVVVLAKASSLSGALLTGVGLGITGFLLTRSVVPGVGSITMALVTAGGAVALLVAGLVAEYMCTIPPEDDDKPDPNPRRQGIQ